MSNKNILAVDDEKLLLMFMADFLKGYNYPVTTCSNANEALEMIRSNPDEFNLIITDQTMPGMTGLELVKEVRELENNTPVILYSGYKDLLNEESIKEHDVSYYLQKPVDNSHLLKCIENLIS